ncbi:hypothetical protein GCM10017608_02220 [Agromyces luteolus]|nr:hypothetical protein GCM10017608_02220 [Agromyces luteolus]
MGDARIGREQSVMGEPEPEWEFVGVVEPLAWGRSTYTVIRIPPELADAAREVGTRRIGGTMDDVRVNLAVTRAPVIDGPFVWAGRSLLRRLGVEPGVAVFCRLRPVDPDEVDTPADVAARLDRAGVRARWEGLDAATRRRRLYSIDSARTDGARSRRIDELVELLGGGGRTGPDSDGA